MPALPSVGGSVGAECPYCTFYRIGYRIEFGKYVQDGNRTLMLLVGCGAAGAIGGIFQSADSGIGIHFGSIDDRSYHVILAAVVNLGCMAATVSYITTGSRYYVEFHLDQPLSWNVLM